MKIGSSERLRVAPESFDSLQVSPTGLISILTDSSLSVREWKTDQLIGSFDIENFYRIICDRKLSWMHTNNVVSSKENLCVVAAPPFSSKEDCCLSGEKDLVWEDCFEKRFVNASWCPTMGAKSVNSCTMQENEELSMMWGGYDCQDLLAVTLECYAEQDKGVSEKKSHACICVLPVFPWISQEDSDRMLVIRTDIIYGQGSCCDVAWICGQKEQFLFIASGAVVYMWKVFLEGNVSHGEFPPKEMAVNEMTGITESVLRVALVNKWLAHNSPEVMITRLRAYQDEFNVNILSGSHDGRLNVWDVQPLLNCPHNPAKLLTRYQFCVHMPITNISSVQVFEQCKIACLSCGLYIIWYDLVSGNCMTHIAAHNATISTIKIIPRTVWPQWLIENLDVNVHLEKSGNSEEQHLQMNTIKSRIVGNDVSDVKGSYVTRENGNDDFHFNHPDLVAYDNNGGDQDMSTTSMALRSKGCHTNLPSPSSIHESKSCKFSLLLMSCSLDGSIRIWFSRESLLNDSTWPLETFVVYNTKISEGPAYGILFSPNFLLVYILIQRDAQHLMHHQRTTSSLLLLQRLDFIPCTAAIRHILSKSDHDHRFEYTDRLHYWDIILVLNSYPPASFLQLINEFLFKFKPEDHQNNVNFLRLVHVLSQCIKNRMNHMKGIASVQNVLPKGDEQNLSQSVEFGNGGLDRRVESITVDDRLHGYGDSKIFMLDLDQIYTEKLMLQFCIESITMWVKWMEKETPTSQSAQLLLDKRQESCKSDCIPIHDFQMQNNQNKYLSERVEVTSLISVSDDSDRFNLFRAKCWTSPKHIIALHHLKSKLQKSKDLNSLDCTRLLDKFMKQNNEEGILTRTHDIVDVCPFCQQVIVHGHEKCPNGHNLEYCFVSNRIITRIGEAKRCLVCKIPIIVPMLEWMPKFCPLCGDTTWYSMPNV